MSSALLGHLPLILGHRGASALAPENTLTAFSRAIEDGADGIEFDVRLARDDVPVVIHDDSLKRTASIDAMVSELTSEQLQEIDVGKWFDGKAQKNENSFAGETIPTLSQVFELFEQISGLLYLEMKCDPEEGSELAAAVVNLIVESRMQDRVVVESFDLAGISEIKRINSGIRTAALFEPKLSRPVSTIRRLRIVDIALAQGADEIALHHTLAGPRVIEKAKQFALETVVWTVDDREWIGRARQLGIKALIANDPGAMVRCRNEANIDLQQ